MNHKLRKCSIKIMVRVVILHLKCENCILNEGCFIFVRMCPKNYLLFLIYIYYAMGTAETEVVSGKTEGTNSDVLKAKGGAA